MISLDLMKSSEVRKAGDRSKYIYILNTTECWQTLLDTSKSF